MVLVVEAPRAHKAGGLATPSESSHDIPGGFLAHEALGGWRGWGGTRPCTVGQEEGLL